MKYTFLIIAITILFACNKKGTNEHIQLSNFENTINLSIDSGIPYDKTFDIGRSRYLYKIDSLLITQDVYTTEKCMHFFANHKYLKSVGQIGKGANEIVRPGLLFLDIAKNYLWITDWGRVTYKRYRLDSLLYTDNFIGRKFNFKKTLSQEMQIVSDTSILCNIQYEPPYLYRIVSENGTQEFAKPEEILPDAQKLEHPLYMTSFDYAAETQRIYMAFRHLDALMCIDTTGKVIFLKKFFDEIGFMKKIRDRRDKSHTFSHLKLIDDKIFVLYCGLESFRNGDIGQPVANYPDKLMIFDLKGNPLTLIKFDGEIADYIYDSDNKELIIISLSSEIYPLITYKIEL